MTMTVLALQPTYPFLGQGNGQAFIAGPPLRLFSSSQEIGRMELYLAKIVSWSGAAWAFVIINAIALFRVLPGIMERTNEARRDKAAIAGGLEKRLYAEIERLDGRCNHFQAGLNSRATLLGQGAARQDAQRIISVERAGKGKS